MVLFTGLRGRELPYQLLKYWQVHRTDSQAGELDVLWAEHMFVDERPGLDASTPCMASTA